MQAGLDAAAVAQYVHLCWFPAPAVGNCLSTMRSPTITSSDKKTSSTFLTTYAEVAVEKRSPEGNRALMFASTTPSTSIFTLLAARRSIEDWRRPVTAIPSVLSMFAGMIVIWARIRDGVFDPDFLSTVGCLER